MGREVLQLPVVDLESETLVEDIKFACSKVGFFYLKNHGVSKELWDEAFNATKSFFALPLEEKLKVEVDSNHRGYTRYLDETLDVEKQTMPDTKEGFYLGRDIQHCDKPLHGPNNLPADNVIPGWKNTVETYFDAVTEAGNRLLKPIALALGCEGDFFLQHFDNPMLFLRLLHYSAHISIPEEGVFAAGSHTDFGMLTLLATDEVPGLQIYTNYHPKVLEDGSSVLEHNEERKWIDVPPIPYVFIVNLGDMLERWTNGYFCSTLHRVVNTIGKERYSIPFFFEPNFDTHVEPLKQFCTKENPSKYPPTTSGQHLLDCYARTSAAYLASTKK